MAERMGYKSKEAGEAIGKWLKDYLDWKEYRELLDERLDEFKETHEDFSSGKITPMENTWRNATDTVGLGTDALYHGLLVGLKTLTPKPIEEAVGGGLEWATEKAMEQPLVQDAVKAGVEWGEENPRWKENLGGLLPLWDAAPVGMVGTKGIDALTKAAPNHLRGFYSGGQIGQVKGAAGGVGRMLADVTKDNYTLSGVTKSRRGQHSAMERAILGDHDGASGYGIGQLEQEFLFNKQANAPKLPWMENFDDWFHHADFEGKLHDYDNFKAFVTSDGLDVPDDVLKTLHQSSIATWGHQNATDALMNPRPSQMSGRNSMLTEGSGTTTMSPTGSRAIVKAQQTMEKLGWEKDKWTRDELLELTALKELIPDQYAIKRPGEGIRHRFESLAETRPEELHFPVKRDTDSKFDRRRARLQQKLFGIEKPAERTKRRSFVTEDEWKARQEEPFSLEEQAVRFDRPLTPAEKKARVASWEPSEADLEALYNKPLSAAEKRARVAAAKGGEERRMPHKERQALFAEPLSDAEKEARRRGFKPSNEQKTALFAEPLTDAEKAGRLDVGLTQPEKSARLEAPLTQSEKEARRKAFLDAPLKEKIEYVKNNLRLSDRAFNWAEDRGLLLRIEQEETASLMQAVEKFITLKKNRHDGVKLEEPDAKWLAEMEQRLQFRALQRMEPNKDGRPPSIQEVETPEGSYFILNDSSLSSHKALGGVNHQITLDPKGRHFVMTTDDNDIMGFIPPGWKRIVSVHRPRYIDMDWSKWRKNTDKELFGGRKKFVDETNEMLGTDYSINPENQNQLGFVEDMIADRVRAYNPTATKEDIAVLMRNWALTGNVVQNLTDDPIEEER